MINNQKKQKWQPYNNLPRAKIFEIYNFVLKLREKEKIGQRKIKKEINKKYKINFSENTISGWIHRKIIPYANEKTQFKPKPLPPKKILYKLYIKQKLSASKIALKYKVSTIIVINWLRKYKIKVRTHTQSMNTSIIKKELREKQLTKPTRNYEKLSPAKAYILGVLCGDGHINNKGIKLEIRKDLEFIEEFSKSLEEVYGIKYEYYHYKPKNSLILNATSEIISKDLMRYCNFKTKKWHVPRQILESKNEIIIGYFLRGLFDSDGSAGLKQKSAILYSTNLNGLKDVSKLLKKFNIKHSISEYKRYNIIGIYRKSNVKKFKEKIGFTIKRKNDRL